MIVSFEIEIHKYAKEDYQKTRQKLNIDEFRILQLCAFLSKIEQRPKTLRGYHSPSLDLPFKLTVIHELSLYRLSRISFTFVFHWFIFQVFFK